VAAGRLSSYRFRRRLLWSGIWLGFVASAVLVGVFFWNTVDYKETFSNEPAQTFVAPKKITLTSIDKSEIGNVARRFVETAVAREHPEEAYELVGPLLKGGMTRDQWRHGDIPVVYYPVDGARWKFDYATEVEVGLSVLLFPKQGETVRPTVFNMAVAPHPKRTGWLITGWSPRGGTPDTANVGSRTPEQAIANITNPVRYSQKASTAWLLLPVAFLAMALLFPVAVMAKERHSMKRLRRKRESA
jgi:hypothetical protein